MKKIGLLTTLLIGSLLVAGCFEKDLHLEQELVLGEIGEKQLIEEMKSNGEQTQRINDYPEQTEENNILVTIEEPMDISNIINLKIGDKIWNVTLEDNTATKALLEKLQEGDIVVNAHDYGNFEKVGDLGFKLPTEDSNITTQLGDLVLYNGNQVSLFYNSNSWSYTRLGKVQRITESDLGDGDVTLVFSLIK